MAHQLTENVKLLQKAVLLHEDRILIVRRSEESKSRPGCWDLPGGNSEWPENIEHHLQNMHMEDISREIKEETGLTVNAEHFSKENLVFFRTFFEYGKEVYSIITGWKVELPSDFERNSIELSDEHVEFSWVAFDELSDFDFGGEKGSFVVDIIRAGVSSR